jgi:hypothetical protein
LRSAKCFQSWNQGARAHGVYLSRTGETLVRVRQPDHNDDATHRVAPATGRDLRVENEFYISAFPSRVRDACGPRDTSRQHNTHNTERREVCYPWHPWYGRSVWIYEALVKNGQAVFRCGTEENRDLRYFVPQWMFDPVFCCRTRKAAVPVVGCEALRDLKALLQSLRGRDVVLQGQHHSWLSPGGGADAKVTEPIESRSIPTVSSASAESVLAGTSRRSATENPQAAGTTAARVPGKSPNRREPAGGAA